MWHTFLFAKSGKPPWTLLFNTVHAKCLLCKCLIWMPGLLFSKFSWFNNISILKNGKTVEKLNFKLRSDKKNLCDAFVYKVGSGKAEQNKIMKIMEFDNYSMSPIAGIINKIIGIQSMKYVKCKNLWQIHGKPCHPKLLAYTRTETHTYTPSGFSLL